MNDMYVSTIIRRDNNNIDLVRILAALLVVWCHSFALSGGNEVDFISKLIPNSDTGGLGVGIFFFFSGLLVTNSIVSKRQVLPFIVSRFFRLYPAYLVAIAVSVFIVGVSFSSMPLWAYLESKETWYYIGKNLIYDIQYTLPGLWNELPNTSINGSLWSLPVEIGCYISVLFCFITCSRLRISPIIPLLLFLGLSFLPHSVFLGLLGIGYSAHAPVLIFCFVLGCFMAVYKDSILIDKTLIGALLMACMFTWRYQNVIRYLFPVTVALVLLYATSTKPLIALKPRHDVSYGLYIWHWPIMQIIISLGLKGNAYLVFGVGFVITYAISYLSAILIEEPCINLGKTIVIKIQDKLADSFDNGIIVLIVFLISIIIAKCLL